MIKYQRSFLLGSRVEWACRLAAAVDGVDRRVREQKNYESVGVKQRFYLLLDLTAGPSPNRILLLLSDDDGTFSRH